jgi:hypothetical protein
LDRYLDRARGAGEHRDDAFFVLIPDTALRRTGCATSALRAPVTSSHQLFLLSHDLSPITNRRSGS